MRWGGNEEETNMVPYRDKRYHTLSNVTREAKNVTTRYKTTVVLHSLFIYLLIR